MSTSTADSKPATETLGNKTKMEIIRPDDDDKNGESCRTFVIHGEDHTLGNPLRYMVMKDPRVQFCGYTVPHPSEDKINFRVQSSGCTAEEALETGLKQLHKTCGIVLEKFETAHERFNDKSKEEAMDT